jgi:SAM-dependent methyltransferase
MRAEEARRIADLVAGIGLPPGSVCLNVGSSIRHFREVEQPHIHAELIGPLEAAGVRFVHCDLKADDGVDLVGNVLDTEFQQQMADRRADILLCCNILEHLTEPQAFADACANLVRAGGYMVVTVPYSYPYHADPIDTMLRVDPAGLARFFPDWELARGEIVESQTFLQETLAQPGGSAVLIRHLAKVLVPFYRPRRWRTKAHRTLWLFRPYKISVALLRKPTVMNHRMPR